MSFETMLELRADTIENIRREVGLEKPGDLKAALDILREWIRQQRHFKRKDFPEHYLEYTLVASKGSIERAKRALDKLCTLRTLWPKFFGVTDIKKDFADIFKIYHMGILPGLNKNNERVFAVNVHGKVSSSSQIMDFYRYMICLVEYLKTHDYVTSYHFVVDVSTVNISDLLAANSPIELKQALTITMECYGMRFKGMYFITASKLIEALISMVKSLLKPKLAARIHHITDHDKLVGLIGKEYLPKEMGGTAPALSDLHNRWVEVLSSDENMKHLKAMNEFGTDEDLRSRLDYNQEYAGMPGTFRYMTVD